MSHSHLSHHRETLAQSSVCTIEVCVCGCVHVTLGAVTVRLGPEVADLVHSTLGEGLARLRERSEMAPRRARAGSAS